MFWGGGRVGGGWKYSLVRRGGLQRCFEKN